MEAKEACLWLIVRVEDMDGLELNNVYGRALVGSSSQYLLEVPGTEVMPGPPLAPDFVGLSSTMVFCEIFLAALCISL